MKTVLLLIVSNIFMTFAWYGHLKFKHSPLISVILISWLIAFVEYCFQVKVFEADDVALSAQQEKRSSQKGFTSFSLAVYILE